MKEDNKAYCLLTDFFGISHQDVKNIYNIIVIVFSLEINTYIFIIQILIKKFVCIFQAIFKVLSQSSVILKEIQSFTVSIFLRSSH